MPLDSELSRESAPYPADFGALLQSDARREYGPLNNKAVKELEKTYVLRTFQKTDMLLAATGDKPVSLVAIESDTWKPGEDSQEVPAADDTAVRIIAGNLGLHIVSTDRVLEPSDIQTGVVLRYMLVSRSAELAEAARLVMNDSIGVKKADGESGYVYDEVSLGTLLGFPATAVAAYAENRSHASVPHIKDLETQTFTRYALSEEHEEEELATGRRWAATVKTVSPAIYSKEMDDMAVYLKQEGIKYDDSRRRMGRLYARFLRSRDI